MDKYNILFKNFEIYCGCHEKVQLHQAGEKNQNAPKTAPEHAFFFAGGCLGWSRAERPSVSWTKVLETLCLQQPKEMFNIKNTQKHAIGHK